MPLVPTEITPGQQLLGSRDIDAVAKFFDVSKRRLKYHLYDRPTPYRTFEIPKRSGGTRTIEVPPVPIVVFQKKLAAALAELYVPKATAHGFVKGRSIVTNARHHLGARLVLNIDLQDFFHSIHFGRVFGLFQKPPFSLPRPVAAVLAQLCCYNKRLPQGAPTSPVLSNLVCRTLDRKLSQLGKAAGARYSRYADDITFSTRRPEFSARLVTRGAEDDAPVLSDELVAIIQGEGFAVNDEKTRVLARNVRQEVTGLKINEKLNVPWNHVRSLRGALWCWKQHGYAEANRRFQAKFARQARSSESPELHRHVQGKLAYLSMVRGNDDPVVVRYWLEFAKLTGRRVSVGGPSALQSPLIAQALWLVLGLDSDGDPAVNGTAFWVEGVGFVTNHHVCHVDADSGVKRWVLAHPERPSQHFDCTVRACDKHFDVAILESVTARVWAALVPRKTGDIRDNENVLLAGFPNWMPGQSPRIERGHVTARRTLSLRRLIQTTCSVYEGNSGGPILGEDGQVIAIATYDASSCILPHGAVEIGHVMDLHAKHSELLQQR